MRCSKLDGSFSFFFAVCCSGNAWSKTGVHFFIFFILFFATLALADAAAEEAALEAVDTLAPCYIFVCVVYTCVADFPKCVYKKRTGLHKTAFRLR